MAIFNSYVKLPEGNMRCPMIFCSVLLFFAHAVPILQHCWGACRISVLATSGCCATLQLWLSLKKTPATWASSSWKAWKYTAENQRLGSWTTCVFNLIIVHHGNQFDVLLVKIFRGRCGKNPIYHHRLTCCFSGVSSFKPLFFHQPMGI